MHRSGTASVPSARSEGGRGNASRAFCPGATNEPEGRRRKHHLKRFCSGRPDRPDRSAQGLGYLASGVPFFVAPQYIVDQCWGSKGTPFQAVTMRFLGLSYTTLGGAVLLGATDDCGPKTRRNMHKVLLASGVANYFVCAEGKKRGGDAKIFDGIIGSSVLLGAASAVAAFRKD